MQGSQLINFCSSIELRGDLERWSSVGSLVTMVYIQNMYEKVVPIIANKPIKWSVASRASFPLLTVVRSAQNTDFDCTLVELKPASCVINIKVRVSFAIK